MGLTITQKGTNLRISIDGKVYYCRLSHRVSRKFEKNVLAWVYKLLDIDPTYKAYYVTLLRYFLENGDVRVVYSEEFFTKSQELVELACERLGINKYHFPSEGALSASQQLDIIKTSLLLKLFSLFLHTNLTTEEEAKPIYKRLLQRLSENGVLKFLLDYVRLKFSTRTSTTFWGWYVSAQSQDMCYHVLTLYHTLLTTILTQLVPSENPLAYIKGVTDRSIYYLIVDVYLREVKFIDSTLDKCRYTRTYSLIEKHAVMSTVERLVHYVKDKYQWGQIVGRHNTPVFRTITLPFLTRLMDTSYIYLTQLSYTTQLQLNAYVSEVLRAINLGVPLLQRLLTSYSGGVKQHHLKRSPEMCKVVYESTSLANVYKKVRPFERALTVICDYTYWSFEDGTHVEVVPALVAQELDKFYTTLFTDKLDRHIQMLRVASYDPSCLARKS